MISLEQVKLLESKVTRTIEYVKKVTEENTFLKGKLDTYQKRIGELEVLIQRFKEDQNRIEDGILSALDRLNQFEDALETTISREGKSSKENPVSEIKPAIKKEIPVPKKETATPAPVIPNGTGIQIEIEDDPKSAEELDIF